MVARETCCLRLLSWFCKPSNSLSDMLTSAGVVAGASESAIGAADSQPAFAARSAKTT
ncbi:hypothetical protein D3C81_1895390 [compost metagenome]